MQVVLGIFKDNIIHCDDGKMIKALCWRKDDKIIKGYKGFFQLEERAILGFDKPKLVVKNFLPIEEVDDSLLSERVNNRETTREDNSGNE